MGGMRVICYTCTCDFYYKLPFLKWFACVFWWYHVRKLHHCHIHYYAKEQDIQY